MQLMLGKNETAFDDFLLAQATFTTSAQLAIDGHFHPAFYSEAELSDLKSEAEAAGKVFSMKMIRWGQVKSQCFDFIKGTRSPLSFMISLYLAEENIEKFLTETDTTLRIGDIAGLSLNLKFDGSQLQCTSATSLNTFTTDRTVDRAWDQAVTKFFDRWEIPFEEL